uniref:PDZ domain-containing protein n=1 Tax=Ciona savignyi TaxID=51511 RepID=H2ZIS8_CIOSA
MNITICPFGVNVLKLHCMGVDLAGFSIKGGWESNKPLVISKVEHGGKAESGGLYVGDMIHSINHVLLSGMRGEAIQLVKSAKASLLLEIERGGKPLYDPAPCDERLSYYITKDTYTEDRVPYEHPRMGPNAHSRGFDQEKYPSPDDAIVDQPFVGSEENSAPRDLRPVVTVRMRKARSGAIERPRSWHASKHPDESGVHEDRMNMRSPGGGYLGSPASQRSYIAQSRRSAKGWHDSGDLKSAFRSDVNGSKDSLISGDSQHSYRSSRLSVSSSRSSGTMSSSRGSLDNLDKPNRLEGSKHKSPMKRPSG